MGINLQVGLLYEVKRYHYHVAGYTVGEIEILCFDQNSYGAQGTVTQTGEKLSLGKTFTSEKEVLDEITVILEKKLIEDPFVQHSENLFKLQKIGASQNELQEYYDKTFYSKGLNPPSRPFSNK
ncbi:hypothetical protein [Cohnella fermenti]|uniref:Uncharacterized protein n=1 Tax=Cohnella fermenti TaxID=2565925 RepID=A0A4S4BNS5_9BACL|nr:hypothetical protein [Cohnella fermenti]THF76526.1 hypothetical protein E6C55_18480 [Cohnella fermenti]